MSLSLSQGGISISEVGQGLSGLNFSCTVSKENTCLGGRKDPLQLRVGGDKVSSANSLAPLE